jgi:hypothetical protein
MQQRHLWLLALLAGACLLTAGEPWCTVYPPPPTARLLAADRRPPASPVHIAELLPYCWLLLPS